MTVNGPIILKEKMGDEEIIKKESEWDSNDFRMAQLNEKAMHTLFCALGPSEYNSPFCENAKEVRDKLQVTHEGINWIKETKIVMLTHENKLLSKQSKETMSDMYNHFANIINNLNGLGKTYSNKELVKKF